MQVAVLTIFRVEHRLVVGPLGLVCNLAKFPTRNKGKYYTTVWQYFLMFDLTIKASAQRIFQFFFFIS